MSVSLVLFVYLSDIQSVLSVLYLYLCLCCNIWNRVFLYFSPFRLVYCLVLNTFSLPLSPSRVTSQVDVVIRGRERKRHLVRRYHELWPLLYPLTETDRGRGRGAVSQNCKCDVQKQTYCASHCFCASRKIFSTSNVIVIFFFVKKTRNKRRKKVKHNLYTRNG